MTDLNPGLEPTAERLREARPIPRAGFRAELRAQLLSDVRHRRLAPGRLRLLIAAQACSGAVLLAVVAVGVAGAGPLAA